jgi:DNA polymerase I
MRIIRQLRVVTDEVPFMHNPHPTVYLIDGSAYIYRAFHAIRNLSNSRGMPTNAVYGFARMILKLMEERQPSHVVMLFDARGPTFRHDTYPDYKANRPPMPEALSVQQPYIRRLTEAFRIPQLEVSGYEADDLIGTLARQAEARGFDVVMVTGDKDLLQLVTERATIWDPMKEKTNDIETIRKDFGLSPAQLIDVMGLSGDSADNIPGVPGIGPKTAAELIRTHGSMDSLYTHLDEVASAKQREKLEAFKDQAWLSRKLVEIRTDAPVDFDAERFHTTDPDAAELGVLFKELEFTQLQKMFPVDTDRGQKQYHTVATPEALQDLVDAMKAAKRFAIDTETTSQDPMRAKLVGVSVAMRANEAYYIPCGHRYLGAPTQLPRETVLDTLRPLLENRAIAKVGQNIKYDLIVLARHGVALDGIVFDTMIASYLLNPSKRAHNLDQIALDFLDHQTISYEEVTGKGASAVTFDQVTIDKATTYAAEDADITWMAYQELGKRLEKEALSALMATVEIPLVPVLARMEMTGIGVDRGVLERLSREFEEEMGRIEKEIYRLAGEHFNINSGQQLGHILFEKLGLPTQKKTRKRIGYSTDVEVLTTLAADHPLPAQILRHRTLAKLKSTYADSLMELIHPETGRIHTSFNQTVAATGRLSSSDPNLQNIPIRTSEGRRIRAAFVPREGFRLMSADYSQIELRVLAHCSGDPILIESFAVDEDIHTRTASEVFGLPPARIGDDLRRQAKAINFGIIYGMSPFGLSRQLGISQKMARTYIDHYFSRYQGVKRFIDETIAEARRTRRTSTLLGRIRLLPDIDSSNSAVRQFAERTAVNTPIQGTAADIIKLAMIRVDALLQAQRMKAALLLSVHDEIVLEAPPEEQEVLSEMIADVMGQILDLKVPLKVNVAWGANWAEAH